MRIISVSRALGDGMSAELAAAGDLATGGLIGRAVEPRAGETAHGAHGHGMCLNCGTALVGDFCHACGQTAHVHTTLSSIGHDLLHGVFHFDGKIWNTVPMLFTRPGQLTRRYIAGERARFVSPLALFLFSVFLMVATLETIGGPFGSLAHTTRNGKELTASQVVTELTKQTALKATLEKQRDALKPRAANDDKIDAQVDQLDSQIDKIGDDIDGLAAAKAFNEGKIAVDADKVTVNTGLPSLDARIKKAIKSPDLFLYKVQSSAYKFSWMLVPISLPFIWLLFAFRRDVGPYDHAIFAIYSLCAMTLGFVGLSILHAFSIPTAVIGLIFTFGPPLHMYKQLRGAYGISRFGALWRTFALLMSATVAATLFFVSIISLAA
jgi:hypothetical protein